MTEVQRVVLLVAVAGVLFLTAGVGTVAADAPDCSTVSYNGDGTTSNPYEVSNVDQLQCIEEQGLGANYVQVSDIDASETSDWNFGEGFDPIGELLREQTFNGTFNGQGYKITDLTINRPRQNGVGLFGGAGSFIEEFNAELTKISLINVDITGSGNVGGLIGVNGEGSTIRKSYVTGLVDGNEDVGGLVGGNSGGISDSYATTAVDGDGDNVGGLVGNNGFEGDVFKSYATGTVDGDSNNVGGLIGSNTGEVSDSYATGSVEASFRRAGGLVGNHGDEGGAGTISNSYATGSVEGTRAVGGLVGDSSGFPGDGGTVTDSYATGPVNGSSRVGGLVGFLGIISDSYWDVETTGQSTSAGGTGLNTSEMTGSAAPGNMTDFDFNNTWASKPNEYPMLAWEQKRR